ncbi:MAG: LPS export ABC transporter periplasmic protein LptC [Rhizobiaceae bacterium]
MFAAANRHSNRVRVLKVAIPAVALAGAALLAAATIFRPEIAAGVSTEGVSLSDGRIVMANPKLDGMTGDKRPYSMRAERAYQEVKKDGLIELETITAEMPFGAETTAQLVAGGGFFDNANNLLDLAKGVRLVTSDGMVANLRSARIDIGKNGLSTIEPVDITTKGSHITADTFSISDGGKLMIFEKRVRLTVDPKKLNNTRVGVIAPKTE